MSRLRYFAPVFNGSRWLAVSGRDKDATWRSLAALCHRLDWSRPRALYELQNGLHYRTVPPGHVVDWHHPHVETTLNINASTVQVILGIAKGVVGFDIITLGVEVLPPSSAAPPGPWQPKLPPADIEGAVKKIADAHPAPDWLPFPKFWEELKDLLGSQATKRVALDALKYAPHLRGKRGYSRKKKSPK